MLELLLSEQCVCVCVCVCPLLQVCVCVHCSRCVCVHYCVCVLGRVKCREHISPLVILCIIVYVTKKKNLVFFQNRYPIMVKCLNIGTPIYRSISTHTLTDKVCNCLRPSAWLYMGQKAHSVHLSMSLRYLSPVPVPWSAREMDRVLWSLMGPDRVFWMLWPCGSAVVLGSGFVLVSVVALWQ